MTRTLPAAVIGAVPIPESRRIPQRTLIWLSIAYFVLGLSALIGAAEVEPHDWWLHGVWCFTGLTIALPTLSRALRQGFSVVLTEHALMFLAAFSLYFLFGASLLAVGPEAQAQHVLVYYPIGAQEALRVDAMNGMGFGLTLLTAALAPSSWIGGLTSRVAGQAARVPPQATIALFLLIGAAASMHRATAVLGVEASSASGVMRTAGNLAYAAIFLAAAHRGPGERFVRPFAIVLAAILTLVGILELTKSYALLPLAALTGGLAVRFGSRRVLPLGLTLLVGSYLALGNVVAHGRNVVGVDVPDVAERLEAIAIAQEVTTHLSEEEEYASWGRLCYVSTSAAGLELYDSGQGGDGLELLPWLLVPRALFPDKPEITRTGKELHTKISGRTGSSTGQGVFASGYYHGGWWGFVLASILCGWVLAQTSAISRSIQEQGGLMMLPFSLMGLYIAFRIDGDFVSDYVGAFIFIIYPLLAVTLVLPSAAFRGREAGPASVTGP